MGSIPLCLLGDGVGNTPPEPFRIVFVRRDGVDAMRHARIEFFSALDE